GVVVQDVRGLRIQLALLLGLRRGQRAHLPLNSALRFSTNAFIPSFWSSVANRSTNVSRSMTRPVRRSTRAPQFTETFAARSAAVGPAAYSLAASTARSYTSVAGNTASTRPISSPSFAGTNRPL